MIIKLPFWFSRASFKSQPRSALSHAKLLFKALSRTKHKKKETNYSESANKLTARWIRPKKKSSATCTGERTIKNKNHIRKTSFLDHKLKCNSECSGAARLHCNREVDQSESVWLMPFAFICFERIDKHRSMGKIHFSLSSCTSTEHITKHFWPGPLKEYLAP